VPCGTSLAPRGAASQRREEISRRTVPAGVLNKIGRSLRMRKEDRMSWLWVVSLVVAVVFGANLGIILMALFQVSDRR
jgi:predicted permease